MTKTQLIDHVAQETGLSKVAAKRGIDSFISAIVNSLRNGEKVNLSGFGSFVVTKQPARIGRNFRTGASVEISARTTIKFRPSENL